MKKIDPQYQGATVQREILAGYYRRLGRLGECYV